MPSAVPGLAPTADGVLDWIEANPNLEVAHRGPATIGGLRAEAIEFGRANSAKNLDPGCPADGRPCVGLFGFPQWDGFYSQGGPFRLRLTAADATWGGQPHVIYAMTEAADESSFAAVGPIAKDIIEGARLPLGVSQ